MKRLFIIIHLLMATVSCWAIEINGIAYKLDSHTKTAEVTPKASEYAGTISIPSTVTYYGTDYTVTSIGEEAFANCTGLTMVNIPNTVTNIDLFAFLNCSSLVSVTIPNSVTNIGFSAFAACSGLTAVVIPTSVTSIGKEVFAGCDGLTSIVVESGNSTYDSREGCNAIIETATHTLVVGCRNTDIPHTVTSIAEKAFFECSTLTAIDIPHSVTSIGEEAFAGCYFVQGNFKNHSLCSSHDLWGAKLCDYDQADGLLVSDHTAIGCRSSATSITIPPTVQSIGNYAFAHCKRLTSVSIGASVMSIGEEIFSGCDQLTTIVVAADNATYDSREGCNAIIETPTNTLVVGCKNTVIPGTVTSIGEKAFYECSNLSLMNIPHSVTCIGDEAFSGCSKMASVNIPTSVTYIGYCAFADCSNLKSMNIPASVTEIGENAFWRCFFTKNNLKMQIAGASEDLWGAFLCDYEQTDGLLVKGSTAIGCRPSATSVIIPNTVNCIAEKAFAGCEHLTSVTIPSCVTTIEDDAFFECASLKKVINLSATPQSLISSSTFTTYGTLYVPQGCLPAYKDAEYWKDFSIEEMNSNEKPS